MAYNAHGFRARAVRTDRPTLATAAYMDWSAELRHSMSFAMAARSCCTGATQLQNFPPRFDRIPELPGVLPPVRVAACVAANCARCEAGRGGFQFPWIGTFTRRDVLVEAGVPAWARVSACTAYLCVRPPPALRSTMWRRATSTDWWPLWRTSKSGATRGWLQPMIFDLWRVWRTWQRGERRWREPAKEPVAGREAAIRDAVARKGRT